MVCLIGSLLLENVAEHFRSRSRLVIYAPLWLAPCRKKRVRVQHTPIIFARKSQLISLYSTLDSKRFPSCDKRFNAIPLLLGRIGRFSRKGRGISYCPSSVVCTCIPEVRILIHFWSFCDDLNVEETKNIEEWFRTKNLVRKVRLL